MLDENNYKNLLRKLNNCILHHVDEKSSVSPTPASVGGAIPPGVIFPDMGIEHLSDSELRMLHVNLHRFYPRGVNGVDKEGIERLHRLVKEKIGHTKDFDQLDRSD